MRGGALDALGGVGEQRVAGLLADPVDVAVDGRDGLIVFRLESLFSWSEFVPVDRTVDDSEDDDADRVADDLDYLSLSRHGDAGASRLRLDLDLPSAAEEPRPDRPAVDRALDFRHAFALARQLVA